MVSELGGWQRCCRQMVLLLLLGCSTLTLRADPAKLWPAEMSCEWAGFQLECRFRPLVPVSIGRIELAVDEAKPQPISNWRPFVKSGAVSAVLWLVDVSNPGRNNTVSRQIALLRQWLEGIGGPQRLGLAAFAEGAEILAPIGSDPATLSRALDSLAARGHSTAFYRSLLDGISLLRRVEAQRKSLWVFSDGLAEDTAYAHDDVVAAARAAGVMIVGLGYPEKESQQTDLQRLQRLAEDSGGYYAAAPVRGNLAPGTLAAILAVVDGGGDFRLDLPGLYGSHRLTLRVFASSGDYFEKRLTVTGALPSPPAAEPAVAADTEQSAARSYLLWFGTGAGLAVLPLWLLWSRRRPALRPPLLAWLECMPPAPMREMAIHARVARLGRARDNDLRLYDESVSAYHAELRQDRDGLFSVFDLGSTNGVWVNGKQVSSHSLHDGDVLEFGEVRLRYRQDPQRGWATQGGKR